MCNTPLRLIEVTALWTEAAALYYKKKKPSPFCGLTAHVCSFFLLKFFFFKKQVDLLIVYVCVHVSVPMWGSKGTAVGVSFLLSPCQDSGNLTQVVRVERECGHLLNHLIRPDAYVSKCSGWNTRNTRSHSGLPENV